MTNPCTLSHYTIFEKQVEALLYFRCAFCDKVSTVHLSSIIDKFEMDKSIL